jgi:hypothetical protein
LAPHATAPGRWSRDGIATAITTGVRPGDRILAPAMPWPGSCALAEDDPAAPVARLLSLDPGPSRMWSEFGAMQSPRSPDLEARGVDAPGAETAP